jgi:hypothetical protein
MWDRVGPIRVLWRILDGKVESGLISDSELRGGSPSLCRLRTTSVRHYVTSINYVLTHTEFIRSRKLSTFDGRWVGWYLTSPTVMYTEIVYGAPTDSPVCGIVWKTCTREKWNPTWVFDRYRELWPLVGSGRPHMCHVAWFSLTRCILIQISVTPSDMSDDLVAVSKRRSVNSIMFIWELW